MRALRVDLSEAEVKELEVQFAAALVPSRSRGVDGKGMVRYVELLRWAAPYRVVPEKDDVR